MVNYIWDNTFACMEELALAHPQRLVAGRLWLWLSVLGCGWKGLNVAGRAWMWLAGLAGLSGNDFGLQPLTWAWSNVLGAASLWQGLAAQAIACAASHCTSWGYKPLAWTGSHWLDVWIADLKCQPLERVASHFLSRLFTQKFAKIGQ